MWTFVWFLIGAVVGAAGMYIVAPRLRAIQQKAVTRLRQLGG